METRRIRADLIEVFKIMTGLERLNEEIFFKRRSGMTRGQGFKIFKKRFKLDVAKFSFGNRVCNIWNELGEDIVQVKTVNKF